MHQVLMCKYVYEITIGVVILIGGMDERRLGWHDGNYHRETLAHSLIG